MNVPQNEPLAPRPRITDLEHGVLHYSRNTYCGHPREGIFQYFGKGEMIVGHYHAPCNYEKQADVYHGSQGYHGRSVLFLQRSKDGGKTWPAKDDVVVWDETVPAEHKRAFLSQGRAARAAIDMFRPDAVFFFGKTWLPERGEKHIVFALRSADKGRTWEKVPTIVTHPDGLDRGLVRNCHPVVKMPDGKTLLAVMSIAPWLDPDAASATGGGIAVYASTDQGLSWKFQNPVVMDRSHQGRFTYANLLCLPDGRLQSHLPAHCRRRRLRRGSQTGHRHGGIRRHRPYVQVRLDRREGRAVLGPAPRLSVRPG